MIKVAWPEINTLLRLESHHVEEQLTSRLEDHHDFTLHLSAPSTLSIPVLFADLDSQVLIQWTTARGVCEVMATVTEIRRSPLPLWIVTAHHEPILHQRRNFARLTVSVPVVFEDAAGKRTATITADLSEGGMRCIVAPEESLLPGAPVEIEMYLGEHRLVTHAVVVRTKSISNGLCAISMQFEGISQSEQDRIRQFIFAEQLRSRALYRLQ